MFGASINQRVLRKREKVEEEKKKREMGCIPKMKNLNDFTVKACPVPSFPCQLDNLRWVTVNGLRIAGHTIFMPNRVNSVPLNRVIIFPQKP